MNTVQLKSGNTLETSMADFNPAWDLAQESFRVIGGSIGDIGITSMDDLKNKDFNETQLMAAGLKLISSKEIFRLIWPCFARCTYNGLPVSPETFESEKSRSDFLPCVMEIFKLNVLPFFGGLGSLSMTGTAPATKSQKSR